MSIVTIENVSPQPISIIYKSIDPTLSATSVAAADSGLMTIHNSKRIDLEETRTDKGQLDQLRQLGLIKYTTR